MPRFILLICSALLIFSLSGCAYVDTRAPYDRNLDNTELGTKVGRASNQSVLWLVAWGDASYATAAKNGGITVLKHADVEVSSVLFGLYMKQTIIVYGD